MAVLAYGADVGGRSAGDGGRRPAGLVPRGRAGRLRAHRPDGGVVGWVWLRAAGAQVAAHGLGHHGSAGSCVAVCNHQSTLDPIVVLRTLPLPLRVLAMRELFRIPLSAAAPGAVQAAARALALARVLLGAGVGGPGRPDGAVNVFRPPIAPARTGRQWVGPHRRAGLPPWLICAGHRRDCDSADRPGISARART